MEAEEDLRKGALARLAGIFRVPVTSLKLSDRFGDDLKPSFVSDFRRNELDQILDDIHDVADQATERDIASGQLVVRTVGDYCDHMVRCSRTKPREVARVIASICR